MHPNIWLGDGGGAGSVRGEAGDTSVRSFDMRSKSADYYDVGIRRPLLLDLGPDGSIPPQPMRSPMGRRKGSPDGRAAPGTPKLFREYEDTGPSVFQLAYERSVLTNTSLIGDRISGAGWGE